jgi:hypothetical protein
MSKKIKKVVLPVGALTLVGAIGALTASQLAYLTAEETATNIFTIGDVELDVKEPNYPGNDSDEVKHVLPNQEIKKDPQIENTGDNAAFAFADITFPVAKVKVVNDDGTELDTDAKNQILFTTKVNNAADDANDDGINDNWVKLGVTYITTDGTEITKNDDGKYLMEDGTEITEDNIPDGIKGVRYLYGYKQELEAGSTTPSVFDSVKMKNVIEGEINGTVQEIAINGMAIQSDYLSDDVNTAVDTDLAGADKALSSDTLDDIYTIFSNQNSTTEQDADISNKLNVKGDTITTNNTIVEINPAPADGEAGATTFAVGATTTFTPSVKTYVNAALQDADNTATWTVSSNNPSVAKAEKSEDGTKIVVTGISAGTATITMESSDGAKARVTVTVEPEESESEDEGEEN